MATPKISSSPDSSIIIISSSSSSSSSSSFPFLSDEATIQHIQDSRVMFIMRGLPGSGKSTLVQQIKDKYPTAVSCSADDYFLLEDGSYDFNPDKLRQAHASCQTNAVNACKSHTAVVVIDNTHVRRWEMNDYVGLARQYGYTVVVVLPTTWWRFNPVELAQRNKHKVSEEVLARKVEMFDQVLPTYWAWFLNGRDTERLLTQAEEYYKECLDHVGQFASYKPWSSPSRHAGFSTSSMLDSFRTKYHREGSSSQNIHCTACFAGRDAAESARSYGAKPVVKRAMGRRYQLTIVGFVFTPDTAGARVRLSKGQLKLWAKDDNESSPPRTATDRCSEYAHSVKANPSTDSCHDGNSQAKVTPDKQAKVPEPAAAPVTKDKGRAKKEKRWKPPNTVKTQNAFSLLEGSSSDDEVSSSSEVASEVDLGDVALWDETETEIVPSVDDPPAVSVYEEPEHKVIDKDSLLIKDLSEQEPADGDCGSECLASSESDGNVAEASGDASHSLPDISICDLSESDGDDDDGDGDDAEVRPRFRPISGLGSRAHITLGYAGTAQAVQTGFDLIEVVQCEQRSLDHADHVTVDGAAIKYHGGGRCVVYLDEPITVSTLFSGSY